MIPHSDGAGVIDEVGDGVPVSRVGERVWCYGAVHVAGKLSGSTVLVQGGGGAVGQCAVGLARQAGALAIATVRSERDEAVAQRAGAHHVVRTDGISAAESVERIRRHAPDGIDHVVEVAFNSNITVDEELLGLGGSIATYATGDPEPTIPFWPLVFKNVRLFFLGSNDFSSQEKSAAASGLNEILESRWPGFEIEARFPLESIAEAHEAVEERRVLGRVIVTI